MILSIEAPNTSLQDYGIQIPLLPERYTKTLAAVCSDVRFSSSMGEWLLRAETVPFTREQLLRVHSETYVDALLSDHPRSVLGQVFEFIDAHGQLNERFIDHPKNRPLSELVEQRLAHAAGTLLACETALEKGFCYFLGGGAHHAMSSGGRGFCLVNDIVISIRDLQFRGLLKKVWVIDLDAHKGDGTAELTIDDKHINTLSIHMQNGWPLDEDSALDNSGNLKRSFWPSTIDVPVPEGAEDAYLSLLKNGLNQLELLEAGSKPDLAIVVDGSDPYEKDVLKSAEALRLSLEQCVERSHWVYQWLRERNLPQVYVMAGGYGPENWRVHAGFLQTVLPQILADRGVVH